MTEATVNLSRYLADDRNTRQGWWLYKFPNGHTASVIPDQRLPFRFEIQVDGGEPVPGQTTEQVEARLAELADAPVRSPDTAVAYVTVDERGRLTPESTVTVGEWTWPVPETYGTVIWLHRVGRTLRDHGWSVTGEPRPGAEAGLYEVPVRPIKTNET